MNLITALPVVYYTLFVVAPLTKMHVSEFLFWFAEDVIWGGGGGGGGRGMGKDYHVPAFSCHWYLTKHFTSTVKKGRRHHISQNVICPRTFDACTTILSVHAS